MVGAVLLQAPTMVNVVNEPSRGILMDSGAALHVCPRDWEPQRPVTPHFRNRPLLLVLQVCVLRLSVSSMFICICRGCGYFTTAFVVSEVNQPILSVVRLQGLRIQTVFRERSAHLLFPNGKTAKASTGEGLLSVSSPYQDLARRTCQNHFNQCAHLQ